MKNQGAPSILSANLSQKTARMDPLSWSEHGIGSYSLPNPSTELEKTEATNAWLWGWLCQHKLKAFTRLVNSFSRTLNSHHVFMFSSGPVLHTFVGHNIVSLMSSLVSLMSLPPTVPAVWPQPSGNSSSCDRAWCRISGRTYVFCPWKLLAYACVKQLCCLLQTIMLTKVNEQLCFLKVSVHEYDDVFFNFRPFVLLQDSKCIFFLNIFAD